MLLYQHGDEKQERVCTCQRRRKGEFVRVLRDRATARAHFHGLESCSNVWLCPLCSLTITERRRSDLQAGIDAWAKQGGEVYLMTLTLPHVRRDDLGALLELIRRAAKVFKASAAYKATKTGPVGRIGNIRALEVTWGSWHGFHPHLHELVFAKRGQLGALQALQQAWIDALLKVGAAGPAQISDLQQAAFDVQNGDYAAEYVAKFGHEPSFTSKLETGETWGVARELTKGQSKISRRLKGRTMFTLLVDYERGDVQAGEVFREYAAAIKHERQLYWSPKLRATLGLGDELTDEELTADELAPRVETVAELNRDQWALVISRNARYGVLLWAERAGASGVSAFLDYLRTLPVTHSAGLTTPRQRWT